MAAAGGGGVWSSEELYVLSSLRNDFTYLFKEEARYQAWKDVAGSMRFIGGFERSPGDCEAMCARMRAVGCHIDKVHIPHNLLPDEQQPPPLKIGNWNETSLDYLCAITNYLWADSRSKSGGDPEFWVEAAVRLKRVGLQFSHSQLRYKFGKLPQNAPAPIIVRANLKRLLGFPPFEEGRYRLVNRDLSIPGAAAPIAVGAGDAGESSTAPQVRAFLTEQNQQQSDGSLCLSYEVAHPSRLRDTTISIRLPVSVASAPLNISFRFSEGPGGEDGV